MTLYLLLISLVLIPFTLELGLYPFLQNTIVDFKTTKEFLAILFAITICLNAVYRGDKLKCVNLGLLLLVGYIVCHPILSPVYTLELFNQNLAGMWEYKPIAYACIYFGMFCVLSNLRLKREDFDTILKTFMWLGFITSIYVFIQYLGLDQFQSLDESGLARNVTGATLTGTLTQPNYSGLFIAMMLPAAIYFRRWIKVLTMVVALLLIDSKMALFAFAIGSGYMLYRHSWKVAVSSFVGALSGLSLYAVTHLSKFTVDWNDNGRFSLWRDLWHGITTPWIGPKAFPLLGHGLGGYTVLWYGTHPSTMSQAHNDYLQFIFDGGLIGLALLIFSIFWLLKRLNPLTITDDQTVALMAILFVILVSAVGLFTWQINPHQYFSVVVFALLHNKLNHGETGK